MSALGQKQTCAAQKVMSALPPKADMCGATRDVRFVPTADIGIQCAAAKVLRRTSAMVSATSDAILGPCFLISENSASEIRSRNPVLKLGHSRAKAHQAITDGLFLVQRSSSPR